MQTLEASKRAGPYQRIDRGLARVEGAVAVGVLLGMVLVASLQALFFNLAERDLAWARAALDAIDWADTFLQKGTLWLAFVGASLATHHDRHIGIDVLAKLATPRVSRYMRVFASFGSGLLCFVLAYVFYQSCLIADEAVPLSYEVLTSEGRSHVCDVAAASLGQTPRPALFCALRDAFGAFGIPISSGGGAAQLIVPLGFVVMALRLLARGVHLVIAPEALPPALTGDGGSESGASTDGPPADDEGRSAASEESDERASGEDPDGADSRTKAGDGERPARGSDEPGGDR